MASEIVFCSSPFRFQKTEVLPPLFSNASALVGKHYTTETQPNAEQGFCLKDKWMKKHV